MSENYEVKITRKGGPEVLMGMKTEIADPQPGEVRIKVIVCGLAFADLLMRHGLYPGVPKMPFTPGYEMVGRIESINNPSSKFHVGQTVAALTVTGAYARYININEDNLVPLPDGIDPCEAACLPLNYVTAWQMIHRIARVKPDEKILVHGAAGGVGTALVQLASLTNSTIYGTASIPKHEMLRSMGVIPIDYRQEDFVSKIMKETRGEGVDTAFDGVGGKNLWRTARTLNKQDGVVVAYGFLGSIKQEKINLSNTLLTFVLLPAIQLFLGRKALFYSIGDEKNKNLNGYKEDLTTLFDLLKQGKIHPVIAKRMSLNQSAEAHSLLQNMSVSGKILLVPD